MTLAAIIDSAIAGLNVDPSILVTDRLPTSPTDLPAATISVSDVDRPHIGIGGIPAGPEAGALAVNATIDLALPELDSGGEILDLLDPARTTLIVPNGPIVTAAGSEGPPFAAGDATINDPGGPFTITNDAPNGREARINPDQGTVTFGQALPAAGQLSIDYHIGVWEVAVTRYTGLLHVDIITDDGGPASTVARQVAGALELLEASNDAFQQIVPIAWDGAQLADWLPSDHLIRRLSYRFVFELRTPSLPTSGGVISQVAVLSNNDGAPENYQIPIPT